MALKDFMQECQITDDKQFSQEAQDPSKEEINKQLQQYVMEQFGDAKPTDQENMPPCHAPSEDEYGDEYSIIPIQPIASNAKKSENRRSNSKFRKSNSTKRNKPERKFKDVKKQTRMDRKSQSNEQHSNYSRSELSIPAVNDTLLEPEEEKKDEVVNQISDKQMNDPSVIENAFQEFFQQANVETLSKNQQSLSEHEFIEDVVSNHSKTMMETAKVQQSLHEEPC